MKIHSLVVGPLAVNCTILDNEKGNCIIFDAGDDASEIDDFLVENSLKPVMLLNTHGHFDHVGAVEYFRKKYNIPFYINREDEFLVKSASKISEMYGLPPVDIPKVDEHLSDGDILEFGDCKIKTIGTPGHSPGGVCFYIEELNLLIAGDTLFRDSIGRTDFPYANHDLLIRSIKDKLFVLDDNTNVITGHGEFTTIGHEKRYNPFLRSL
jgi:glyoxylase-like metal-dependent hydrolase (beta-lactamase superfamily II)